MGVCRPALARPASTGCHLLSATGVQPGQPTVPPVTGPMQTRQPAPRPRTLPPRSTLMERLLSPRVTMTGRDSWPVNAGRAGAGACMRARSDVASICQFETGAG